MTTRKSFHANTVHILQGQHGHACVEGCCGERRLTASRGDEKLGKMIFQIAFLDIYLDVNGTMLPLLRSNAQRRHFL